MTRTGVDFGYSNDFRHISVLCEQHNLLVIVFVESPYLAPKLRRLQDCYCTGGVVTTIYGLISLCSLFFHSVQAEDTPALR